MWRINNVGEKEGHVKTNGKDLKDEKLESKRGETSPEEK